jgi:hypothetical protein
MMTAMPVRSSQQNRTGAANVMLPGNAADRAGKVGGQENVFQQIRGRLLVQGAASNESVSFLSPPPLYQRRFAPYGWNWIATSLRSSQ